MTTYEALESRTNQLARGLVSVGVRHGDELPRNATGKVLETALRSTYGVGSSAVSR